MTTDDKKALFSDILTRAASDLEFREQCLASETSAMAAVAEFTEVPADFSVTFIDKHSAAEKTNRVIFKLTKFQGDGTAIPPVPADRSNVVCTYDWW
jgi:hypothetical protein